MSLQYDVIIIGCGPAGEAAASLAADFRKRVAIVDARGVGAAESDRADGRLGFFALREAAMVASGLARMPLPGLHRTETAGQPLADFAASRQALRDRAGDRIKSALDRPNIDLHAGRARLIDGRTVDVTDGEGRSTTLKADFILIATGSMPHFPAGVPADHPRIAAPWSALSLETLPGSLLIAGGDAAAYACASIFAALGVKVTLACPDKSGLPFLDVECRDHLALAMKSGGVEFRFGSAVRQVDEIKGGRLRIVLDKGQPVESDAMLWHGARRAAVDGLDLEQAGVELTPEGFIAVDEFARTNVSTVFAAGDTTGSGFLASTSVAHGRHAVSQMFETTLKRRADHLIPTCLHTIPPVSCIGVGEDEAREAGLPVVTGRALLQFNARGQAGGERTGILKCIFNRHNQKLLGAVIVGREAPELIHLAQHVMIADGGIDDFIGMSFNQPTLSELYRFAAYAALQSIARFEERDDDYGVLAKVA